MHYIHINKYDDCLIEFYYDDNGKKGIRKYYDNLPLSLGIESKEPTGFKDLYDKHIKPIYFKTLKSYYEYIEENENFTDIYGNIQPEYQFINHYYGGDDFKFNLKNIKTLIVDIEVSSDKGFPDPHDTPEPIISIAVKDKQSNMFYASSLKPYDKTKVDLNGIVPEQIKFHYAKSERDLLEWFIALIETLEPDILIGWYSENFDFPYIINRSYKVFGGKDAIKHISPVRQVYIKKALDRFKRDKYYNWVGGIYMLDYLRLYEKFTFKPREMYSLDYIAQVEVEEEKVNFEGYDNLNELWCKNPQKFIDYNIYDTELVSRIDDKLKLINLLAETAFEARCNLHDAMGTTRIWDVIYYNTLKKKNIMIPPLKEATCDLRYPGAYVKDCRKDMYKWLMSLDLNSLYPHLQMQFNISPECLTDIREDLNLDEIDDRLLHKQIDVNPEFILAGNGCYFRKDVKGFMAEVLKEKYDKRKAIKLQMLEKKKELEKIKKALRRSK